MFNRHFELKLSPQYQKTLRISFVSDSIVNNPDFSPVQLPGQQHAVPQNFLAKNKIRLMNHPLYSPYHTPRDIFSNRQVVLKETTFESVEAEQNEKD